MQRHRNLLAGPLVTICVVAALTGLAAGATRGDFTTFQAEHGAQVYAAHCAVCHGNDLQGQAGPALAGEAFQSSLEFSGLSAQQLYNFISTQMPANAPGKLSKEQYLSVFSYILSKNGYPEGSAPLTVQRLGEVALLPYPGSHSRPVQGSGAR